ncbi:hypothetical protein CA11_05150 [Gimesia maris]|nr:hypothetical protein CA11_05150 [Gimesia maris]
MGWGELLQFECRASHDKCIVGPADNGTRCFYYDWHGSVCLLLVWWFEVCFHRTWEILWKGMGRSSRMNRIGWRYESIRARYLAVLRWYRVERLRSAATRRHTSRTGVVSGSANLEKTGCFIVQTWNKWCVFRCTVNWSRARLSLSFIVTGARASRGVYAA